MFECLSLFISCSHLIYEVEVDVALHVEIGRQTLNLRFDSLHLHLDVSLSLNPLLLISVKHPRLVLLLAHVLDEALTLLKDDLLP